MQILGIQIVGILLALFIFYQAFSKHKKGKLTREDFRIWGIFSIVLLIASLVPTAISYALGTVIQMGRGLDALLVIGLLGTYALLFQLYTRTQETNRQITDLVRKVALQLEEHRKKPATEA